MDYSSTIGPPLHRRLPNRRSEQEKKSRGAIPADDGVFESLVFDACCPGVIYDAICSL